MTPSPRKLAEREAARGSLNTKEADAYRELRREVGDDTADSIRRYMDAVRASILSEARDTAQVVAMGVGHPTKAELDQAERVAARVRRRGVKTKPHKTVYLDKPRGGR